MEINIIIKILNDIIKNKESINCWDIKDKILIIDNIIYLNKNIKNFYKFELVFMLQNEYVYKKNQIDKYREIQNDISNKNKNLKLHQIMMGKGKSSVLTPLLAFSINLLTNKIPNIITLKHLKNDIIKYTSLTKLLFNLNISIVNDYEAKERWIIKYINNNNKEIPNFKNEINIIDEFDSQYNYLQ